ncbi:MULTISPECIES: AAA family ATPase [unclassified Caballeronia]|uniref:AAA family ATPase n=1 Tax=unclassified Caballeronia TaxID=2646786 RepID=UPI0020298FC7|nr:MULTISPECIES: AAA family ATPase [unclassified Caballeronia]
MHRPQSTMVCLSDPASLDQTDQNSLLLRRKVIATIRIENYKSITSLPLELGRVNVLIGENGAGKSNILEAIALAGAAAARKLDNEFLVSRGIRVVRPADMRPAFAGVDPLSAIKVTVSSNEDENVSFAMVNDNEPYSKWTLSQPGDQVEFVAEQGGKIAAYLQSVNVSAHSPRELTDTLKVVSAFVEVLGKELEQGKKGLNASARSSNEDSPEALLMSVIHDKTHKYLSGFITYSPENSALRTARREGQIEPLGISGEGVSRLFAYYVHQAKGGQGIDPDAMLRAQEILESLDSSLRVLGWFDGLRLANESKDEALEIRDFFVDESERFFEYSSANEGFFFLLFYFLLFASDLTPPFFAIDNIDASLNPGLCRSMMRELVELAKKNQKQVIFTTHNPAVLDGLNLDDDEQRLFVVRRNLDGKTMVDRVLKPRNFENLPNLKMSEAFMRGLIGGISSSF